MDELTFIVRGAAVRCAVERDGDQFLVRVGGTTHRVKLSALGPRTFRCSIDGRWHVLRCAGERGRRYLHVGGQTIDYELAETVGAATGRVTAGDVTTPMPGTVTQVLVEGGDWVERGQPLVIVEAMKMEHIIRAPRAARVRALRVSPGDRVDGGVVVAEIDGNSDEAPR